MDNLRKSLIVLFQDQNPSKMLDVFLNGESGLGKNNFFNLNESEDFQALFNDDHKTLYNKDEISNVAKILQNDWSRLGHYKEHNVFNVVVKFATRVLKEQNNEPICEHKKLFKWRDVTLQLGEDLFTTAFLAHNDLMTGKRRSFFTWRSIIKSDDVRLKEILRKGIAENHFHLNGSSPHFQLAWISLMNKVRGRETDFRELRKGKNLFLQKISSYNDKVEDIETLVKKAAMIRLFLFENFILKKSSEKPNFKKFYESMPIIEDIQDKIAAVQYLTGKRIDGTVPDYAIPKNLSIDNYKEEERYNGTVLLYGERYFLYSLIRLILNGDKEFKKYIDLLYIYLCIKQKLRNEIIQINKRVGFGNFADYQNRKEIFIPENSIYDKAIVNIAINSSLAEQNIKYLETRIAPKNSLKALEKAFLKIESKSKDTVFFKQESLADRVLESGKKKENKESSNYFHTIHFIKKEDKLKKEYYAFYPRHHQLRMEIEKQAYVINEMRKSSNEMAKKIYGIDAANIEIGCRPEVFAPAFRYLKNYKYYHPATRLGIDNFYELGQTFHVGEDFLDLLDGMRAIDEVMRFLNFSQGDRFGHALAVGINAKKYYEEKEYTLILHKQVFLDNIAWVLCKKNEYGIEISTSFLSELETLYRQYYREIYSKNIGKNNPKLENVSYRDYFESWKLRGDSPYPYREEKRREIAYSFKEKCYYNDSEEAKEARRNKIAEELYIEYHYNPKVKIVGGELIEYKIENFEYIRLVEKLQIEMQKEIARKNIYIETNPSSNILIGQLEKYINHPIFRFNNFGLEDRENPQLSVSINTDDQGVFSTCLENEYALIVLALMKQKDSEGNIVYNPADIYEWIDKVRERSLEHSFERIYEHKKR